MRSSIKAWKAVPLSLLLSFGAAQAQDDLQYPGWVVGAGYVFAPDPFVGDPEDASRPIPIVGYIGERLTWLGPYLGYRLTDDAFVSIVAVAELGFDGFDHVTNDPALQGLVERKSAVDVGFDVEIGPFGVTARTDVSDRHGGQSVDVHVGHSWGLRDLEIGLSVGAEWQSADLVNYYYGVSAGEATALRAPYSAGSAINFGLGVELQYQLNKRTTLLFGGDVSRLGNNIRRSPIVDDDFETAAYIALVYQLFE